MAESLPAIVFAFNRPALLQRVLGALKGQGVSHLVIFVDGPRRQADVSGVDACRALASSVTWAETERIFKPENRGLTGLIENIDHVFERFPAAVFVEDDCLPSPGFYPFMQAGLEHYAGDKNVFSIGGYQPVAVSRLPAGLTLPSPTLRGREKSPLTTASSKDRWPAGFASARFICWGWGSRRERWQEIRPLLDGYAGLFDGLRTVPQVAGDDIPWIARKMADGEIGLSWDIQVALACLRLKKIHIHAARGLVRNIGLGAGGVHTGLFTGIRNRLLQNKNVADRLPEGRSWPAPELDCEYTLALRDFVSRAQALSPRRWIGRGWSAARRRFRGGFERIDSLDLLKQPDRKLQRRALLSYIVHPFFIAPDDPRFSGHINIWHAREMVRVLNGMGYCVDVVDYQDTEFIPQAQYDLFIGHGGINFTRIAEHLPASTPKIYFSTGAYWQFHNEQEQQRSQALEQRRDVVLPPDRPILHSEEPALRMACGSAAGGNPAGGILGIGNGFTRRTYGEYPRVEMIDSTARFDAMPDWCGHDYEAGRSGFMFFAPHGNLHKGLDLVLEAFARLEDLQLWVLAPLEPPFVRIYGGVLFNSPNIHTVGKVTPRSGDFYRAMSACDWCLLPSCSEGQSTSVLDAMNQGLIPIVTPATGIDVEDFGELIEPAEVESVRSLVQRMAGQPVEEIRRRSELARRAAQTRYTEERFVENFRRALGKLLEGR